MKSTWSSILTSVLFVIAFVIGRWTASSPAPLLHNTAQVASKENHGLSAAEVSKGALSPSRGIASLPSTALNSNQTTAAPAAVVNEPAVTAEQKHLQEEAFVQANNLVDDAIHAGTWTEVEQMKLAPLLQSLGDGKHVEVLRAISVAVNTGKLKMLTPMMF
jgi:hypothetical protein